MAQVTTSHFNIFNYWKGKIITENGNVTEDILAKGVEIITDWGEPCCWGCGKPIIGHYEKHLQRGDEVDFKKLWNDSRVRSKLNRCHIIPGALGGEDKPENLFLMCDSCHEHSPDTTNTGSFYRWVYEQRKKMYLGELSPQYIIEAVSKELNKRGFSDFITLVGEMKKMNWDLKDYDINKHIDKHVGVHGVKFSESTKICAIADWLTKSYLYACLK